MQFSKQHSLLLETWSNQTAAYCSFGTGIGEYLEAGADTDVVAVAGESEGDSSGSFDVLLERLDADEFAYLRITKDGHHSITPTADAKAPSVTGCDLGFLPGSRRGNVTLPTSAEHRI